MPDSDGHSPAVGETEAAETRVNGPIGIVGVGEIARALVEGLSGATATAPRVLLSPRGATVAAGLATRFPNASVCASNQEVADKASVLVLSVRPENQTEALHGLRTSSETLVISVMAGVSHDELRGLMDTKAPIVRAIPLPAVRDRTSVTATYPTHPASTALFDRLGGTLPVDDEASFAALSAVTGTISAYLHYLSVITGWAARHGIPAGQAERYVRSVFMNLGPVLSDHERSLAQLVSDHETPGGINEQFRRTWLGDSNTKALDGGLDTLFERLHRVHL
jgi:pyrroline-5-carboxylate reductase